MDNQVDEKVKKERVKTLLQKSMELEIEYFNNYINKDVTFIKEVYKRDNYTCQRCGDNKGGNLVAHHLNGYDTFNYYAMEIRNGV